MIEENMIKVHWPGETVWAVDLGNNQAEIRNSPLQEGYAFGDVIEYNSKMQVIRRISSKYREALLEYDTSSGLDALQEEYAKVVEGIFEQGMLLEPFMPGTMGLSFPKELTAEQVVDEFKKYSFGTALLFKDDDYPDRIELS